MFEIDKIILDHPTCSNCAHMTTDSNCEPLCKMMEDGQKIEYPENSKLIYFSACNLWQESDSRKKLLQKLPFEIEGDELVAVKEEFENIDDAMEDIPEEERYGVGDIDDGKEVNLPKEEEEE